MAWGPAACLSDRDRRAVLEASSWLSESDDLEQLARRGAQQLQVLLAAEVCAFTEIDVRAHRAVVVLLPAVPRYLEPAQQAGRTLDDNPITSYWAADSRPGPSRVSDHLSQQAWRATATYGEVLGPMGTPHMLGVPLVRAAQGGPSCAVARSGSDFTDRELGIAQALQVALVALHRHVATVVEDRERRSLVAGSPLAHLLTEREREVLVLLSSGVTAHVMARRLGISTATVRKHLEHLYRKLDAHDRLTAVNRAHELCLPGLRTQALSRPVEDGALRLGGPGPRRPAAR
ncbi:LuxR C-terminal-related transcriptional regulator [uncultured Pseudokineococcus sp.]|uniref:helix-turn-helix transcriptional regulator n=1 Tax=uncultured Pseudokineococcus sp. TaxID=1642928 RepID=UPI002601677C|nr:LuxR C-terminal-related transcriptional regulator [uncultured Pseudokineococcus sp.]